MTEFAGRVRRVRMKDGGAELHVLNAPRTDPGDENWRGAILANARKIADAATDEAPLVGYVALGLFGDGGSSLAYRYDFERPSSVPRMLLPHWVAEIMRRDMIAGVEARDVFDQMFEWQDGAP